MFALYIVIKNIVIKKVGQGSSG